MNTIKRYKIFLLSCTVLISLIGCSDISKHHKSSNSSVIAPSNDIYYKVEFSPNPNTTRLIIDTINDANKSVYVAAYYLTSKPIADSLINAHDRGVDVRIVLDRRQLTLVESQYIYLLNCKIPTRINKKYSHMHHKFMVIDENIVETGSFNYTDNAAKRNAENILIIYNNHELAQKYLNIWQKLWNESK